MNFNDYLVLGGIIGLVLGMIIAAIALAPGPEHQLGKTAFCTRELDHDGPCNGWPCASRQRQFRDRPFYGRR